MTEVSVEQQLLEAQVSQNAEIKDHETYPAFLELNSVDISEYDLEYLNYLRSILTNWKVSTMKCFEVCNQCLNRINDKITEKTNE